MSNLPADRQLYQCPDCKCRFGQPFVCTTCGAQKLYDETVRSQAATIRSLCDRIERISNICHDSTLSHAQKLRQVDEWATGFMKVPT